MDHGVILEKAHRVIEFNKKAWLKLYIDMNTELIKKSKNRDFLKLTKNSEMFEKTIENVRRHRDIKPMTTDRRRNHLASKPNYDTAKCFPEKLVAIETSETKTKRNKSA